MKYTYKTQGTCSSHIELEIEDNIITDIAFWGGCNGNLQGISRLVKGMPVNDVISRLEGKKKGNDYVILHANRLQNQTVHA